MTEQRTAWGWGLASIDAAGNTLDVWYPELTLGEAPAETSRPNHNFGAIAHDEADARGVRRMPVFTVSKLDEPIEDAADAYLRLHLLSMRLAKPNTLNLDGIFAKLNNVVWTNYGPFAVDDFALRKLDVMAATRQSGAVLAPHVDVNVLSIDKFPRMVDYVVPTGVRIGDADRVRLGAHLSEGTTVMHAGFVNFNAGTLGVSMVEGRVSQGVVVGNGSDIGGGASIMGTLSGGGKLKNSIGEHSLLGANAGIGISLGDNFVVEAGLYVTAGTKVTIYDKAKVAADEPLETVKGAELSGKDNILFIRNSVSGRIEARYRKTGIELNENFTRTENGMAESVIRALRKRKLVKITLITVGKVKEKYLRDAIAEYSKRLGRYCKLDIVEVADEKTPEHASDGLERQIKAKEGERIAKHIRDDAFVIALAIEGKQLTSEQLAAKINDLGLHGTSHIQLIIGGSLGLDPAILKRADYLLSFSKMTFPHQLMRVVLLEQIYRAYKINAGEPYHK